MDIKGTITGLTSRISPWGWAAGGVLLIGLVFLLTKGSGSTSTTAMPAADINDWLNQLQSAADSLVDSTTNPPSESTTNPPSESTDGDHPDIPGSKPGITLIDGKKVIGIGGLSQTWIGDKYVPGVGGVAYGDMPATDWQRNSATAISRGTVVNPFAERTVTVESRSLSTSLIGTSNNRVVSR